MEYPISRHSSLAIKNLDESPLWLIPPIGKNGDYFRSHLSVFSEKNYELRRIFNRGSEISGEV